ncbi:MAG: hypothetical protein IT337_03055 [Thermomicrobiales bacterium]|nr:hypothetical protein [Thermomicrobiales bacterium]
MASGRFRPIAAPDSTLVESPAASWAPALDPDLDKWWSSERTDDPARAWDRWDDEAWSSDEFVEPHEAARQRIDSDPIAASDDAGAVTSTAVAEPLSFDITSWDDEALAAATAISPLDGGWGSGRAAPPVDLAPGVPRICRTCRDFRPAEGGERGWCANQWAFTHRRMVGADDPAPCESSIGCWWLPADDLFLSDADISTHGQPTPHLDRWLPHWDDADVKRRKS